MAFREVTMHEVKEVLRQHLAGVPKKRIAARVGLDPKTVRRYVQVALEHGIGVEAGPSSLTEARLGAVVAELMQMPGRPLGENWDRCQAKRAFIEQKLEAGESVDGGKVVALPMVGGLHHRYTRRAA